MNESNIYRDVLLKHALHPKNSGILECPDLRASAYNPLCGDELELTLTLSEDTIDECKAKVRGCSICQASASMMSELILSKTLKEAVQFSMVGDNLDDIQNFLQIFKNAGVDAPKMDAATTTQDVEDILQPDAEAPEETKDEVPGKASTTPDPEVKDTNFMTKDIAGGINKAATDINEYATAVYLTAELCVLGDAALDAVEIIQTEDGKLRVNDQWGTVTRDALDKTSSSVPTIKDAVRRATSAGGGGGGGKSSAQQEAETAVKTLLMKGGNLVGKEGVAAMKGLIQTKIHQSKEMAKVVVQKLREHPFLMKVAESSALPLVQVVGATNVSAAQQSHREAVTLFCERYQTDTFCSFALTEEKIYEIKHFTLSGITDFHKRSPADILVAIDASCFPDMKGYTASMENSPLIIGLSLKSVLNYGQAPFANPGLPSVLGDLRKKLGTKFVPNNIEDIVGKPYKKCVDHLKAAAGVKTNTALKEKFKSAKKGDEMKLGQGGDQDKLLEKLADT